MGKQLDWDFIVRDTSGDLEKIGRRVQRLFSDANALADARVAEERERILALLRSRDAYIEAIYSDEPLSPREWADWLEERLNAEAEGKQDE